MCKPLLALALFAPLTFAQTQTFTYGYSGIPIPIYPDDWNTYSVISVLVPKNMSIAKVTASVTVQYSGVGDLNVFLWSPAGTRTKLLERNCGGLQNINTTFDDSAPTMYRDTCPTQSGSGPFRGNEPLANSAGQNAYGYWRIGVENNGSSRTGVLTGFSVSITGTVLGPPVILPGTVVSTSSFQSGAVAPGDQITLVGANLGPADGVRADASKNLPTSLAGTTVTFDGAAVPIYYASDNFVSVQAPVSLSAGLNTRIQVTTANGPSGAVSLPVVPVNPGIFTYDTLGTGQAKALNQDGTLNGDGSITGSDRAAGPGSVIALFVTGLGSVSPPIAQGTPAPSSPLSLVDATVTATIGGRPATVTYAGAAPGLVGVYQVNVLVPVLAPSGAAHIALTVDGNVSQKGVTVQIR